jgi:RNA polymerase sigma-70 factor (ECF subfamily)
MPDRAQLTAAEATIQQNPNAMSIDQDQFTVLWTKASRLVAAYIASAVPGFHDTEDILQEVALVISRRRADYDPSRPFENWAIGIAKLQILKHIREKSKDKAALFDASLLEQFTEQYETMGDELKLRQQLLGVCLQEVKGRGREAIELRYKKNVSGVAIAQRLDISHSALRTLLHRVRESIRRCIERRLGQQSGVS